MLLTTIIALTAAALLAIGCQSAYTRMETRELSSGERYDSLFLGMYLGMTSQDFYAHCWQLNKEGLIREGRANTSVYYEIRDFQHQASMDFYPGFHEDRIIEMPCVFQYHAWAPWNKDLFSSVLIGDVLELMTKWFGAGFLTISNPSSRQEKAYVKVDGNRRISIYQVDEEKVKVDIIDLRLVRELEGKKAR